MIPGWQGSQMGVAVLAAESYASFAARNGLNSASFVESFQAVSMTLRVHECPA